MRSSCLFRTPVLMLLLSTSALTAQTAGTSSAIFTAPPASQSCPVGFQAERSPNSGLILVQQEPVQQQPGTSPAPAAPGVPTQGLRITFTPPSPTAIVKASITVHGMAPGTRMMPASSRMSTANDATETFELAAGKDSPLLHPTVQTTKLSAITWVELTRVEYADGTIWQPSAGSRCTAAPSLYVLVDSAAAR